MQSAGQSSQLWSGSLWSVIHSTVRLSDQNWTLSPFCLTDQYRYWSLSQVCLSGSVLKLHHTQHIPEHGQFCSIRTWLHFSPLIVHSQYWSLGANWSIMPVLSMTQAQQWVGFVSFHVCRISSDVLSALLVCLVSTLSLMFCQYKTEQSTADWSITCQVSYHSRLAVWRQSLIPYQYLDYQSVNFDTVSALLLGSQRLLLLMMGNISSGLPLGRTISCLKPLVLIKGNS